MVRQREYILNRLVLLAITRSSGVLDQVSYASSKGFVLWIIHVDSMKRHRCLLYNTTVLPPSPTMFRFIKMELVHYSTSNSHHVLKLKCSSLKERGAMECRELIGTFLIDYIRRPLSICPIMKYSFVGAPNLAVTWVVRVPLHKNDSKSEFRTNLIKQKWNGNYDEFWHANESKSRNYVNFIYQIMGGFGMRSFVSRKKRRPVSQPSEYDDVVFAKFSDRETSGFSLNQPLVVGLLAVGILFCIMFACAVAFFVRHFGFFSR